MKKRICSLLLAIVMVIGLLPQTSHAADMVTVISTASELAALGGTALSGDYRLGANIDMTNVSMTPINSLRSGTFDGGGFAISNLSIEGSGNTGLFAELSSGGVITDLTLENCSVLNDSGSYTGTGMLVGQIVGQSEISRCGVVGGSVQSSASSAVYVGGLVGYASSPVAISGCYSTAAVTAGSSSGSRTGGLIGSTSGASSIDSCYARGAVDGGSGYAGGFAGYLYGSYSSKVEVSNSYAAATVTASSGKNYAFGYCYSNYALSACYYDETLTVDAKANTEDGVAAASTEVLKASAALLGSAFQDDPDSSTNDGYPMLKWQDPNATYTVSFSVTPANAVVSFDDEVQAAQPDGQYTFAGLAAGSTHSYLVEQADDTTDYAPQSGTITVGKADVQKAINLQANRYDLTFNVSPSDATLSVTDGENQLLVPEESTHTYSVTNGVYAYQAQAFGYEPLTGGSVTVEKAGATVDVTLNQQPVCTLSVRYGDLVDGAAIENGSLVIWTGEHTVAPKTDGGLVYELPVGYCYQYTFKSSNYEKVTGQVDLTASHEASAQDLTVPLSVKTAWGGADDIAEPQLVDGVYQITSGAELAWLAQQVNAGTGAGYQAALTKNIDLGSEAWTPIGLNYSKRFAGSFDGCGFTISGLHIDASVSGNYGLFGYVEGGTVQNLTVEGQITVTAGSSSYGVAGIVGQLNGAAGTIQNCISSVAVTGAQNVGGIVGYVASGYSTANKSIQSCANLGTVVSTGNNAGGIAGYVSGQVSIDSCYNRGNVTGGGWRAGGIAAYLSSSYATLQNCYTTGVISGSDANPVVGKKDSGTVDNLYYLASLGSDANAVAKTEGELKAASFPSVLGSQFVQDMAPPVNGGYPILTFQDTTPTYTATFTVAPADAVVTLTDLEGSNLTGTHSEQSGKAVWSFQLRSGEYRYQCTAFGKLADQGTLTIAQAAVSRSIVLEESPTKSVSLQLRYSDNNPGAVTPTVTVQCGERLVTAQEGVYHLPYGEYDYVVKAKGYAKQTGQFTISAATEDPLTISVTLVQSASWDGVEQEQPQGQGTQEDPYQIESGAQLAWLAAFVNQSSSNADKAHAVLTQDIDLADNDWTPIGKSYAMQYKSSFDGQGHSVDGLKVTASEYAGLFGHASSATIQNVVVSGTVSSTSYTGGLLGQANGNVNIINCANACNVTGTGYWTGGLVGRLNYQSYGQSNTISGCYNTGTVTGGSASSSYYAGGIAGKDDAGCAITDCYNTGDVTGYYAGGISGNGSSLASRTNCYSTGTITGTNAGAIWPGSYGTTTNCYYLEGGSDAHSGAQAKSVQELKNLTSTLNGSAERTVWKSVSGLNQGYPVLAWQPEDGGTPEGGPLNPVTNAVWRSDPSTGLLTGVAVWDAVPNADSYTAVLWDYWSVETDYGAQSGLKPIKTVTDLKTTQYDFTSDIQANGTSWYYFTITPVAAEGSPYESGKVPTTQDEAYDLIDPFNDAGCYRYFDQLAQATGLQWRGSSAYWSFVDNAFGYLVLIYRVDENNVASYIAGGTVNGSANTLDCRNYFAVGGRYVFSVVALSEEYIVTGNADKNSLESKLSSDSENGGVENGIYTAEAPDLPDPDETDRTDWIAISTAQQWMELANVEDVPIGGDVNTSQQAEAWSKQYYLTADLDFSTLSAADQARTKSIGTVQNRFEGILDGNGHKLTGLTLSNYDSGLFAYIGAKGQVYDVTIEGANVLFSDNAAVLALNNYGTISSCRVVNSNITADTGAVLGGMISRNYGVVRQSYVQGGTLTSNSVSATGHAGFVGSNETGGIIERCWTSMDVNTVSDYAGGFVGLSYGGVIRDCFSLGNVSAGSYSGGFAGRSVYSGNTYLNCYCAGSVTVTGEQGHGFIGGSRPDSAFQPDLASEISNCYYNAATLDDSYAAGKSLSQMQSAEFLIQLNNGGAVWLQSADKNGGMPYLAGVQAPEGTPTSEITVELAVAIYDKTSYSFSQMGQTVSITMPSNGNTRVIDLLDAAVSQGKLSYCYETTSSFGRYIHTINGYAVEEPDGWMFSVNDKLSNVSASLATVTDGDRLLWFEGTTENRFQGPSWDSLSGEELQWIEITSVQQLMDLASSTDKAKLAENYRLGQNLDLQGAVFAGIGTQAHPFTGRFDGQGHTVSNFTVSGTENTGFFGVIKGAIIQNLHLSGVTVTGGKRVGGLVGWAQAELDSEDMGKSIACLIGACTVSGSVRGVEQVGGLVGLNDGAYDKDTLFSIASAIDKCTADASVTQTGADPLKLGGLVGQNLGTITKSCSNGDVTAPDATSVGGLVGDSSGDIYDSYATGQVQGHGTVGGFAGSSSGKVERGYSLGAVQGAEYTGSFAGSIYHADTAVGAGRVTIISGSLTGYNGGFAGSLSGQLTGLANQVTIQTVYGNCIQDGAALNAVGNSSKFQSEAQKELLQQMTLTTLEEVSQRLYTLFGVNLPVPDTLKQEADKYLDQLTAGLNAQPGDSLSLLKEGQSAASGITVNYQTDSSYLTGGSQLIIAKLNDTALTQQLPVTLVLTDENGNVYRKNLSIVLPVTKDQQQSLMDAIAATLADSSDSWAVMDMAVYSSLENKTLKTTQKAYQNALNLLITTASKSDAYLSDRTRVELVLRAMGIDSRKLYPVNSNTAIDNAAALQNTDLTAGGHYAAPWVLLAQLQGNVELSEAQVDAMITLLKDNMAGGLFDSPWGPDPDTAGVALAALARYYDANSSAKDVVDTILAALPGALSETGSLGSANSDAMVILGLLALGRDPADLRAPSGASLIDGLLSYVNPQTNCFQYAGMDNALATEQGFRALVALAKFDGTPYQFYDFSANAVQPGRATGAGEVDPIPEPDTDKTIEVFFTLKTDSEVWVPQSSVTVKEGSTVYHAFVKAMDAQSDMSYVGAEAGYVKSITKAGVTLSEFDKGEHSGWLYKVNGTLPTVGITSYAIEDGDSIVFYYTYDWTKDPDAGGSLTNTASAKDQKAAAVVVDLIDKIGQVSSSSGPAIQAARAAYDKLTGVQQALVTNYAALIAAEKAFAKLTGELPFADVSGHWALEAIAYVYQNDLMNGTSSNRFTPDGTLSRAMAVTALYRLAGSPSVSGATAFQDVAPDSWYHDAVVWASQNGIAKGLDATTFAPDRSITREQIAALLQRYCQQQGHDTGKVIDLSGFWDAPSVSAWAQEAMTWAVAEGLITGRAGDRLAAAETATRAEAAVILMRLAQQLTAQ